MKQYNILHYRTTKINYRKSFLCLILTVICFLSCFTTAYAVSTQKQGTVDSYQPLHIAILMDSSGSIKGSKRSDSSDPDLVSREAAKAFLNCIPSNKNQVTLYHYSDTCIQDKVLTSVDSQENIQQLIDALSNMKQCSGETHMLSAIQKANNYLQTHSSEEYKNVIIVFTDGAENGMLSENANDSEINAAVKKVLGDTDTVVYSVAFDYFDEEKKSHSISKNANGDVGYGKKILDEIARTTGGKVMETQLNAIDELDDQFINIINDLCNIYPERIAEYEGDGKLHETSFEITDSVIEADIRISCDTLDAVNKAKITLVGPPDENETVDFSGGASSSNGKIWYSVDRLAINIKILAPKIGKWKLTISNIKSDSPVYINLIRQYNMSFDFNITTSSGDPQKINLGETVGVEIKLKSDGTLVKSDYFYNLNTMEAYVFLTEGEENLLDFSKYDSKKMLNGFTDVLKNREHTQFFKMVSTGQSFKADIPMDHIGKNLIGVWVCSGRFYCYEDRVVNVLHTLAPSKTNDISDIELRYGEKKTIDDLISYSSYDDVKIELIKGDGDIIGAKLQDDSNSLLIEGKKTGTQEVVLRYTSNADKSQSFEKKFNAVVVNSAPNVPKAVDLEMALGDTVTKDNLLNDITDPDGDVLKISGVHSSTPGILDLQKDDSKIIIKANSVGNDKITIDITDGHNTVQKIINVTVNYPVWFYLLIAAGIILIIGIIIWLLILRKNRSRRLHTNLCDVCFEIYKDDETETYELKYLVNLSNMFEKKGKVNFYDLIYNVISEEFKQNADDLKDYIESNKDKLAGFKNIFIIGNSKASEPDRIKGKDIHIRLNIGSVPYINVMDVETLKKDRFVFRIDDDAGAAVLKFMFNTEQL